MAKALSDGGASLQSDSIEGAETEIEDLLVEPAHWFAPGGFEDPHGEICDNTVDGLQEAALRGDLCLLRKYIRAGSTPPVNAPLHVARGDEYLTLLHVIASKPGLPNSAQILVQLIKANANPNARSTLGSTPLMFACFHKNVQIAEVLLENEADPDAVDDHGKTAVRYAVSLEMKGIGETEAAKRSAQLADILEAQGSDLDHGGLRSPMAEAVIQDNRDAMTRLLELGASSDGLVYALAEKSELVIKELISGGANPFVKNEDGLSCLDVAHERGSEEIMELLQDYIVETERSRSQHLKMKPFGAEDPHWTTKGLEHCQWLISGCWESRKDEEVDNVVSAQLKEIVIKDMGISPQRGTDGMQLCRYQVQAILENPVVQATLTTNLVLALFLPDFWVILAMQGDGGLDNALVMILVIFVLEFIANVVAHGDRYVNKYPFWTDIVGILSVPWDHSLVADNFVDIFEGSGLARVTKFAKLSARAVRLSRLGKLLRFFPGSGKEGEGANGGRGPAKGISAELMSNLSVKVALLIIVLVLILPVMDFFTWPPDDFSLDTWTTHIHWMAKTYPEDVSQVVEDMRRFYDVYSYFPFQVIYHFTNNTQVIQELQNARAPMRLEDVLVIAKEDTTVKFNFRAPKLTEAILNVFVMIGVIFTMLVAAACVSSAVSHTVLSPMEDLLEIVHSTAIQIFDSVEQMAIYFVKDYSNQQWRQEIGLEAKDDHRSRFSREVELLAKVLEKLDLLTIIANAKRPVDEFEQLGNGPAAFCQDYATYAAVRHRLTLPRPAGQLDLEEMEHDMLMQTIGAELAPAEISRQDWNAWDLNIADLNSAQRQSLARCLIVIYDTSPGFDEYHAVRVTKYKCHCEFIKVVESQYEDDQVVQYHNWIHAVDVAFTLRSIFHRISAERYFATHERFALMVASFAHDLGNSGVTNGFLAQSAHEFALGYNDLSCLQNMSCAKLFRITGEPETSIFLNFNKAMQRDVRQVIIFAILHTDPGLQLELLAEMWGHYQNRKELFDLVQALSRTVEEENEVLVKANKEVEDYFWNADVKYSLRNLLVHVADNSYSLKPWDICSHWANALSEEFFKQGDLERNYKMPMQPLNDRVRANVAHAQIVNIQHIIVPQTKLLVQLLPELRSCKHHMWLNLWRWIVKWKRSRPDHEELHRVLREVKELHDEDVPEEEIRALEHQEVDEEGEERRDNKQKIKRRMSVRSVRSVVNLNPD